jgi:hypothetical protein
MMIECCDRPHLHHAAVFDKYTDRRYKEASLLVQAALDAGFTLPNQMAPVRQELDAYREDSAEVPIAQPQLIPIEG